MDENRRRRIIEHEKQALNLEYAFTWGVDFENRVVRLTNDIEMESFDFIDCALTELEAQSKKDITIRICSFGGDVYGALAIIGRMHKSSCKIITEGYGAIMSAATLIMAAGTRKRKISRYAWCMHHEPSISYMEGRFSNITSDARQLAREADQWAEIMEEFTGVPSEFWKREGTHTDAYYNPSKCFELNIVDEII